MKVDVYYNNIEGCDTVIFFLQFFSLYSTVAVISVQFRVQIDQTSVVDGVIKRVTQLDRGSPRSGHAG